MPRLTAMHAYHASTGPVVDRARFVRQLTATPHAAGTPLLHARTDAPEPSRMETVLGPRLLQKPVQDALLGPLLDHIYKPKVNY